MGVGGHKFVCAGAKVRRCGEDGALRWGRAYGYGWGKFVSAWTKVRCGGRGRMGVGVRKYVQKVAHIRIYWGAGAGAQGRNNIFTIM